MDSAYRYGGEEFTVILPETEGKEAQTVAQRIRIAVKAEEYYAGRQSDTRVDHHQPGRDRIRPQGRGLRFYSTGG